MSDREVSADIGAEPATTAPAGFPLPGAQKLSPPAADDLLGSRIAAALIDLAVLAGVAVILSAATGQISSSSTSFVVSLNTGWTLVFLAIALAYYFVLEAWAGQTLGKLPFDQRVRTAAGEDEGQACCGMPAAT
jgi:uncharacterized RDD family membrane protein YckC